MHAGDQGYQLQLYQLPLVAWRGESESYLSRVEASAPDEAAGSVHSQQQEVTLAYTTHAIAYVTVV